jgi:hypothetical protein
MANQDPLQSVLNVNVDQKPAQTMQASQAPTGSGNSPLPTVGTNEVDQWATWDPNQWWTNWTIPSKPQPTWELWFQWVNQLKDLVPAVTQAGTDWQTLAGQFDNALQTVRTMRGQLTDWTGPSAQTMSQSLDNMESSISTKADSVRNNPMTLQNLAQAINDSVGPMQQLDAQYQQVLTNDAECRQVALQGQPIMMGLAAKLLQAGTALENSAQTSNLAPQPTPPQVVNGTENNTAAKNPLTQVAGSSGNADPGNVSTGSQIGVAVQPGVAGSSGNADPGNVQSAQQLAMGQAPTVAGSGSTGAGSALPSQSSAQMSHTPTLAGTSAGTVAPTVSSFGPTATAAPVGGAPIMGTSGAPFGGAPFLASAAPAKPTPSAAPSKQDNDGGEDLLIVPIVGVPGAGKNTTSGSVAVPAGLQGRSRITRTTATARAGVIEGVTSARDEEGETLDTEVFQTEKAESQVTPKADTGVVTARPQQA